MKTLQAVLAFSILSTSLTGGVALAQEHHENHARYVEHKEWKRGAMIRHEDWERAERVDWKEHHLSAPPRGYEWRGVDGHYVLVNPSNFQINAVIRIP